MEKHPPIASSKKKVAESIVNFQGVPDQGKVEVKIESRVDTQRVIVSILKMYEPEQYFGIPYEVHPPVDSGNGPNGGGGNGGDGTPHPRCHFG